MKGACLCGNVEFEIQKDSLKLYQCHCKLCRIQSGTFSNWATIIPNEKFQFLKGEKHIKSWVKDTGFRADFCRDCGASVPNPLRNSPYYWIPAGTLDESVKAKVVSHIFMGSKSPWEGDSQEVNVYEEFPGFEKHIACLNG
ncbi:MAG: GFA family protein [Kangiellaceae bacterium]|nr:GFA family protein [Kangiellaceae bacterium]MCW9017280.1 GFA family protein [Kangiellaceae bacterium]